MLFNEGKIKINKNGDIHVDGKMKKHESKILQFFKEQDFPPMKIYLKHGRYLFPAGTDTETQQLIRNFLMNECPVK